ncbi:MAG TPA: FAD-dependent oxidoreductase, partial [bacterium]|nr:FAD-dependent oxidoreductase [bacterium]
MEDKKLLTVEIDGAQVEVPEGTTILEAATKLGVHIHTLCYNKTLSAYGACRLCLVEVTQGTKTDLRTSCNNVVLPGMRVQTATERVQKTRKIMMELALSRCDHSEKILELAKEIGVEKTRFAKKKDECILCGLCVRMCEERMGKSAIGFAHRGMERKIVPPFDMETDVCQTCGACVSICPTNTMKFETFTVNKPRPIRAEFDVELKSRSPIYIPFPQAMPNWARIDKTKCVHLQTGKCGICKEVCEAKAIDYDQADQEEILNVGAMILAPGIEVFQADKKEEFGFGHMPNVVSSLQFERILCASGPFSGHVVRPSDHKEPRRIAFLQCIGSRDSRCGRDYCSSVCCTYATKEAILAREHCPEAELTIFGMDFRTHGKEFEEFMLRAQNESGVRYVRSRVPEVDEDPETHNLFLTYENEVGHTVQEEFDIVVLSVGLDVSKGVKELAERLNVEVDQFGFARTDEHHPLLTSRAGVFVCGAFEAPKDIPETVMQASAAAAAASEILHEARGTMVVRKEYPPERDVRFESPRIGVFVCSCGSNIAGTVDVKAVTEAAKSFPGVVWAENSIYTCSQDALVTIKERVKEHNLNRVVVASCSPRTHERLFQENIREVGLNRYLFEMANIRDHCSWVHRDNPQKATEKATDLVRGAVAKVRLSEPLPTQYFDINKAALVIGGGVAGMNAALSLASQGFEVTLVEQSGQLGGLARRVHHTIEGMNVAEYLNDLAQRIEKESNITLHLNTQVSAVSGSVGHFKSTLSGSDGSERQFEHGIIIVATGARELETREYGYGSHPAIMTQMEFDEKMVRGESLDALNDIYMIQCVGSRCDEYPNCSRVCCAEAVKNAIAIKTRKPEANVTVLYRDLRTYGMMEQDYRRAREMGVLFVRFEKDKPPVVSVTETGLSIRFHEPVLNAEVQSPADAIILSVGVRPNEGNKSVAPMLKVPLTKDGYFFEAHVKLRPVDFATDGIFVCGMAHGPKLIKEAAIQGLAAASRAATILSKDKMEALSIVSEVDPRVCSGCRLCNTVCAYDAISYDETKG